MRVPGVFQAQFQRALDHGYLPIIQREAARIGETTAHILAICSRETNVKNIRGDYRDGQYHGFGLMQVDRGTDPHFASTWSESNFEAGIIRGCDIYAQKRADVLAHQGRRLQIKRPRKTYEFIGRQVERDDARRVATAAYNCGRWAEYAFANFQHIDSYTTGGDYGRDVYHRAVLFAICLEQSGVEPGAFKREIEAQGDYALAQHQKLAGVTPTPDDKEVLPRAPALDDELEKVAGAYPITVPDVKTQPGPTSPESGASQEAGPTDVKLYIQSLRNTVQDWLAYLGIPGAAIVGWGKAHPEICAAVIIAAVMAFWFYKTHIKHKLDVAAINTAADPKLNTVRFDKRAK